MPIDTDFLILAVLFSLTTRLEADDINAGQVLTTCTYPNGRQVSWVQPTVEMQARSQPTWQNADAQNVRAADTSGESRTTMHHDQALTLQWQARLEPDEPGTYRFAVDSDGELELKIDGKSQLLTQVPKSSTWLGDPLRLTASPVLIEVTLRNPVSMPRLSFFWEGPGFRFEPVPARAFTRIDTAEFDAAEGFVRGERAVQALHCQRCHGALVGGGQAFPELPRIQDPPPSLQQATHTLRREWVIAHLKAQPTAAASADRKMPFFGLTDDDAVALTEYLMSDERLPDVDSVAGDAANSTMVENDVAQGRLLFSTLGCLACHRSERVAHAGDEPLAITMDLSQIGDKRPEAFFSRWLLDPATIDPDHAMPRFSLSAEERRQLSIYLSRSHGGNPALSERLPTSAPAAVDSARERGGRLFRQLRCDACHKPPILASASPDAVKRLQDEVPGDVASEPPAWSLQMDWNQSCAAHAGACEDSPAKVRNQQPRYGRPDREVAEMQQYIRTVLQLGTSGANVLAARQMRGWINHNCLVCHERDQGDGLVGVVARLGQADAPLPLELDTLFPPTLASIGDKMESTTIVQWIEQPDDERLRPWLKVRMPRFPLSNRQAREVADWWVQADRVPEMLLAATAESGSTDPDRDVPPTPLMETRLQGGRLLSSHGFGCLSCHALGAVAPKSTAPGTRGPALDRLGVRVRRTWFDRFLANPLRISRRMEMPSLRQPVPGLLGGSLNRQMHTLWSVLNDPEFIPPPLDPVRTLHNSPQHANGRAVVMMDVIRDKQERMIRPLVVGLADRQTLVFDSERAGIVDWRIGDVASQLTEGKSWYWQLTGESLLPTRLDDVGWSMTRSGQPGTLVRQGQWMAEIDGWDHLTGGIEFRYRLEFAESDARSSSFTVRVRERLLSATVPNGTAVRREIVADGLRPTDQLVVRPIVDSESVVIGARRIEWTRTSPAPHVAIRVAAEFSGEFAADGSCQLLPTDHPGQVGVVLVYECDARAPAQDSPGEALTANLPSVVGGVPGFRAVRLPLPATMMPTGFSWDRKRRMFVSSLKGRVWRAVDTDGDGREDQAIVFSDELPTPYGVHAGDEHVDVITKAALLRMFDLNQDGQADKTVTIASGWGHTDDYHDWAVGLPCAADGRYLVALPCQQDERDASSARFRGRVLELVPREPTSDLPHLYRVQEFARGLRFPMGLALNRDGDLFVTDNQGNYNPFNELNHIERDSNYGFVNRMERDQPRRETTPPAVNVPHPWTRSVNGICFLDVHAGGERTAETGQPFGPFTGQLVGCEYDTRRLIRISLEQVMGVWQGAAYPLSREPEDGTIGFAGPVACAVSPEGILYVGSMRDSGWGGANNRGEVVQLRWIGDNLPQGIAEVNARSDGFSLRFLRPIDPRVDLAAERYRVSSFYRVATPAYGGEDVDRREETIVRIEPQADPCRAKFTLNRWEPGRVYEIRCVATDAAAGEIFPAEAFYTLRQRPEAMLD